MELKRLAWCLLHSIELAKKCLQFLSKNKRHIFHFHQELYWTTYSPFCSTTFWHFSGNFIIPSSQNFSSLWAKNYSRCLLQSSRELKFFPLREFCKDRNKWKSKDSMSGEYSRWIRSSQPICNSFCLVIQETCGLVLSWWRIMCFLLTNSGCFSSSAAFSWSNWEHYLLEFNRLVFQKWNRAPQIGTWTHVPGLKPSQNPQSSNWGHTPGFRT